MKNLTLISALAIVARVYADVSAADLQIVTDSLNNVVAAVTTLNGGVQSFSGPADIGTLAGQSQNVITTLDTGRANIQPIQGTISLFQAAGLLTPVGNLNSITDTTVTNAINKKQALVDACIGPTILQQLQSQLTAATAFRDTIGTKVDASNQALVNQQSQPALDSLQRGITAFSDQTALPASCTAQPTSSAAPVVTSQPPVVEPPVTSQPPVVEPPVTSQPPVVEPPVTAVPTTTPCTTTAVAPAQTCPPAGTVTVTKAGAGKTETKTVTKTETKTVTKDAQRITITSIQTQVQTKTVTAACQQTQPSYNPPSYNPPSYNPPKYNPFQWLKDKFSSKFNYGGY